MSATVRSGTGSSTYGTGLTIAETDGGAQAGDLRVVFLTVGNSVTIVAPSGWTAVFNGAVGAYTLAILTKPWVAGVGTESFTWTTNSYYELEIAAVTGWKVGATATYTTNNVTTGTSLTATGLTPATNDELVLAYFSIGASSGASTATLTDPPGMTNVGFHAPSIASGILGLLDSVAATGATTTGNKVATASQSGSWRAALVSIPSSAVGYTQTDTAGAADSVSSIASYTQRPADAAGVTDSVVASSSYAQTVVDAVNVTDGAAAATAPGGATYSQSVGDAAGVADAVTSAAAIARPGTDAIGVSDSLTVSGPLGAVFTDAVGVADSSAAMLSGARTVTDSAGVTDTVAAAVATGVINTVAVRSYTITDGGYASPSVRVPVPQQVRPGDLLMALWSASKEQHTSPTAPTGWTQLGSSSPLGTGSNGASTVFVRTAGDEPVFYTFPGAAGGLVIACLALTGATVTGAVGPVWDAALPRQIAIPTLSGVTANGLVISAGTVLYGPAATTWTWTGATTKLADGSGARYQRLTVGTQLVTSSGTSGAATATSSQTPDTYGDTTQAMSVFIPASTPPAPTAIGLATEPETAATLRPTGSYPVGRATDDTEQAFALGLPGSSSRPVTSAVTTDIAVALRPAATNSVTQAVASTETAFALTPRGSYPTKYALERDLALQPTNPNVTSALTLALAAAVADPERWLNPSGLAFWNNTSDTTQPFVTLDPFISELTIRRSLEGDLPAEVGIVEGHAAAQAEVVLEGQLDVTALDVVDAFAPYKTTAYFYGKPVIGTSVVFGSTFLTALGQAATVEFTGSVASVSPSSADRSVTLTAFDGANKLRAAITLSAYAIDSLLLKRYGPAQYFALINSQWLVDYIARANNICASPPTDPRSVLSVTLHGSTIPEVGFGTPPQEYAATGNTATSAWSNDASHPFSMMHPNPLAPAMNGTWYHGTQVPTPANQPVGVGVSFWFRIPPITQLVTNVNLLQVVIGGGFTISIALNSNGRITSGFPGGYLNGAAYAFTAPNSGGTTAPATYCTTTATTPTLSRPSLASRHFPLDMSAGSIPTRARAHQGYR